MGTYGYNRNTTPHIDEWAKGAYVFTNMKTLIPTTYPSLSIFMTGITPFVSKIFDNSTGYGHQPATGLVKIDKDAMTLPQILKENGYTTGN